MSKTNPFEEIYNEYAGLVYNLSLNYLQNREEAEEVTQDVFVSIYKNFSGFKENASLKTWIYRIALNKCQDYIKNKNRLKRSGNNVSMHDEQGVLRFDLPNFEHPGVLLEQKEKVKYLFAAIESLAENQKTAFILTYIDGLNNKETAEIMNKSIGSIESLLQRAKESLRKELENYFVQYQRKN